MTARSRSLVRRSSVGQGRTGVSFNSFDRIPLHWSKFDRVGVVCSLGLATKSGSSLGGLAHKSWACLAVSWLAERLGPSAHCFPSDLDMNDGVIDVFVLLVREYKLKASLVSPFGGMRNYIFVLMMSCNVI